MSADVPVPYDQWAALWQAIGAAEYVVDRLRDTDLTEDQRAHLLDSLDKKLKAASTYVTEDAA